MAQITSSGLGASLGFSLGVYDIPLVGLDVVTLVLTTIAPAALNRFGDTPVVNLTVPNG